MTAPPPAVRFRAGGFAGACVPDARAWVEGWVLPDPAARAAAGRVLRATLHRTTSRVAGPDGTARLLKAHRAKGAGERLLSLVRRTRARAEWDAARLLEAASVPVPKPLAFGERRRGRGVSDAFYASEFLEGTRTLGEVAAAERDALLPAVAGLVRRMHDAGFDHRDLHAGNLLVGPEPGALWLTDLHRGRAGSVGAGARTRALARLVASLPGVDVDAVLAAYGTPEVSAAAVGREAARLEAVRRRSRAKRCLVESTVFTRDVGPGRGARRRDLAPERLDRALAEHDEALARSDGRVAKRNLRGSVTTHGDLVVKEHAPAAPLDRLRARLWPGRLAAGYRNAHLLDVLGVGTARPLAFVRRGGRTFSLFEDLSALPRLDALAREVFRGRDPARAPALLASSADWVAGLHRLGVYHGDLKGVNVRVVREPRGEFRFLLIDTDRVRVFDGPVDARRRAKNLAQLAASIPVTVTRADRLRWWRRYAERLAAGDDERAVARDVAARLAEKIVVVDEPIE